LQLNINQLIKLVNQSEISSIKGTLNRIIEVIHNPLSSVMDLKGLIEIDPPLSANVLRLANSAFYGLRRNIVTIMDAIIYIGFESVKELALNQKVCELFQKDDIVFGYSRKRLWMHSVAVAICSKMIYRKELRRRGEDIYAAGILHDLGIIIEDQFMWKDFVKVLEVVRQEQKIIHGVEQTILGYCHEDIGARLAESWNFPLVLCNAISSAERPQLAVQEYADLANTLYIANYACTSRHIGYTEMPKPDQTLYQECLEKLNIREKAVDFIMEEVEMDIKQMEEDGWF